MNFGNFMKCIDNLSYSSMFSAENSKKFHFKPIGDDEPVEVKTTDSGKKQPGYDEFFGVKKA